MFTRFDRAKISVASILISDALPFGRLRYGEPNAISNAIGYAKFYSRSHDAVFRVYDGAGSRIRTDDLLITKRQLCQVGDTEDALVTLVNYLSDRLPKRAFPCALMRLTN